MFVDQRQWVAVIYPLWPLLAFTHIRITKEGKKLHDLKRNLHFTITILPTGFDLIAALNYVALKKKRARSSEAKWGVTHKHVRSITP
ncbi:hypothetical protein BC827DRAFT_1220017 [Russula dissimulans]|nr:hypothetical protein BC827DRAFT_1220017 [Russula dissimulans]